jgi:hypothetical protein
VGEFYFRDRCLPSLLRAPAKTNLNLFCSNRSKDGETQVFPSQRENSLFDRKNSLFGRKNSLLAVLGNLIGKLL